MIDSMVISALAVATNQQAQLNQFYRCVHSRESVAATASGCRDSQYCANQVQACSCIVGMLQCFQNSRLFLRWGEG